MKLVYHSPMYLLGLSQQIVENVLNLEQNKESNHSDGLIMSSHCNFVVISAACIEAHLNWYYHFDKDIDVDNFSEKQKYMPIKKKIDSSPLLSETKNAVNAVFSLRNEIMHPKYQPRDVTTQFPYNSHIMLFSFRTLVYVSKELLDKCPETLKGRFHINERQIELADNSMLLKMQDEYKKDIDWIEAIKNKKIGLPMVNVFDIPKPSK